MGIETGVDVFKIQDVAEDLVVPIMDHVIRIDRDSLTLGYAGVYSSFLLFAKRAGEKYGISARDLLVELGRRGMVGGQEDMIEDTAITMARERGLATLSCYETLKNVVKNDWVKFTTHPKFKNNNTKLWYSVMMYNFLKESSRDIN